MLWSQLDIATTILLLLLFLGAWVLWKVQSDPTNGFSFEEMLRDDDGKPSAFRLAIFVSLAVSTWVLMYIVLKTNTLDTWMFVTYLGIWSGAKVAETAITAYAGSRGTTPSNRSNTGYDSPARRREPIPTDDDIAEFRDRMLTEDPDHEPNNNRRV